MSCPHGNSDGECDLCAELDAKWDAGYAAGKKTATVEIEAVRASALVEIDRLRAEKAALREQLQGGVVVPRGVANALLEWSGAEPSQSVLSRAVDDWINASQEPKHG